MTVRILQGDCRGMGRSTHARLLADLVGQIYGLSEASLKVAKNSAAKRPVSSARAYLAILRSLNA